MAIRLDMIIPPPMTNEQVIRQLPVEELALHLMCPYEDEEKECMGKNCYRCVLDWLNQPAAEGGNND